ncbi:hypothetical protein MXB_1560 [Myxobolus squamalis]|nr:hypothetical protein MXB_1560 [Myxobolus squamalis]
MGLNLFHSLNRLSSQKISAFLGNNYVYFLISISMWLFLNIFILLFFPILILKPRKLAMVFTLSEIIIYLRFLIIAN